AFALLTGCDESGSDEDATTTATPTPTTAVDAALTATVATTAAAPNATATPAGTISAGGDPYGYDYDAGGGTATPAAGTAAATSSGGGEQVAAEIVNSTLPDLTVSVGDTVSWTNRDAIPHTATASDGSFDSGTLGATPFTHTFTAAGTFEYVCAI